MLKNEEFNRDEIEKQKSSDKKMDFCYEQKEKMLFDGSQSNLFTEQLPRCLISGIASQENVALEQSERYINLEAIRAYLPLIEAYVAERKVKPYN